MMRLLLILLLLLNCEKHDSKSSHDIKDPDPISQGLDTLKEARVVSGKSSLLTNPNILALFGGTNAYTIADGVRIRVDAPGGKIIATIPKYRDVFIKDSSIVDKQKWFKIIYTIDNIDYADSRYEGWVLAQFIIRGTNPHGIQIRENPFDFSDEIDTTGSMIHR